MDIDSHFDSGNIEVVDLLDNNIANLRIKKDAGDEHMQWFHFRVDGTKDKSVTPPRSPSARGAETPRSSTGRFGNHSELTGVTRNLRLDFLRCCIRRAKESRPRERQR